MFKKKSSRSHLGSDVNLILSGTVVLSLSFLRWEYRWKGMWHVFTTSMHLPLSAGRIVMLWYCCRDVTALPSYKVRLAEGGLALETGTDTFILSCSVSVSQVIFLDGRFCRWNEFQCWNRCTDTIEVLEESFVFLFIELLFRDCLRLRSHIPACHRVET